MIVSVPGATSVVEGAGGRILVPGASSIGGAGISVPGTAAAFDPATLSLTGWWRTDYSGVPWVKNASAGTSGNINHDLIAYMPASNPTAGTAVNGKTPAKFVAASSQLLAGQSNWATFLGATGSIVGLAKFTAAAADAGAGNRISNPGILAQDTGATTMTLGFSTSGITLALFNTGATYDELAVACGTGAYHCFMATWNGTTMTLQVDSGAASSTASDGPTTTAIAMIVGASYVPAFIDADGLAELMTAQTVLSSTDYSNIKSYFNSRYALSL